MRISCHVPNALRAERGVLFHTLKHALVRVCSQEQSNQHKRETMFSHGRHSCPSCRFVCLRIKVTFLMVRYQTQNSVFFCIDVARIDRQRLCAGAPNSGWHLISALQKPEAGPVWVVAPRGQHNQILIGVAETFFWAVSVGKV